MVDGSLHARSWAPLNVFPKPGRPPRAKLSVSGIISVWPPAGRKQFLEKRRLNMLHAALLEGCSVSLKLIFSIYLVVHQLSPEEYSHISFAV